MLFQKLKKDEKNNFLIYGQPGSGKTWMIGTIVNVLKNRDSDEKLAVFDFRGGMKTLFSVLDESDVDKYVRVYAPRTFRDITEAIKEIKIGIKSNKVSWVAVDNITAMQKVLMTEIKTTKVISRGGKVNVIPSTRPSIDDWGLNIERMYEIVNSLIDTNCNIVFTALAEHKNVEKIRPSLDGKDLADDIAGMCDVVLYIDTKVKVLDDNSMSVHHVCYSQPVAEQSPFIARDRNGVLDPVFEPDFEYIVNKLMGG